MAPSSEEASASSPFPIFNSSGIRKPLQFQLMRGHFNILFCNNSASSRFSLHFAAEIFSRPLQYFHAELQLFISPFFAAFQTPAIHFISEALPPLLRRLIDVAR